MTSDEERAVMKAIPRNGGTSAEISAKSGFTLPYTREVLRALRITCRVRYSQVTREWSKR